MKTAHSPMYAALLRLYPAPYRERYGEETLQLAADMLNEAPNPVSRSLILIRVIADLCSNIGRQQLSYIGGIMVNETPMYLRRNSMIAGVLLLPFILSITANSLAVVKPITTTCTTHGCGESQRYF